MTKDEFITKLRNKISMLEKSEIDDIISEYEGFIDEKMASGMSEKEAVKSLGDVDEIAKDLKSAYKINSDSNGDSAKELVDTLLNKATNGIDAAVKSVENKSASDVIKMIIKVFLLLILIRICKFPVDILLDIANDTFMILGSVIGNFLFYIFSFVVNVIYFILAVMFFWKILTEKILDIDKVEEAKKPVVKKENKKEEKKEDTIVEEKKETSKKEVKETPKRKGFFDVCADIVLLFAKFIVFWIAFGDIFFIVGMSSALAIALYLVLKGVTYFGPLLILLSLTLAGISFLGVFIRFIFNSKQRGVKFLVMLIISLVLGGAGIGLFSIEIANTTIISKIPEDKVEKVREEYKMEDNLVISDYLFTDYVVDNSLKDKIIIEYSYYDDYFKFEPETYTNDSGKFKIYHMNYDATWTNHSFKNLIRDLKKKEIYNMSDVVKVKVIANKENIKKLKANYKEYNETDESEITKPDILER